MVTIAVDPHKRINVVEVIDAASTVLACQQFEHSTAGFKELMRFARSWRRRQWAIEGATGVGKNLAQRLVASDAVVLDVPSRKSSLVRAFSATSGRKSDEVDAHAVALAALNSPDLERVRADDHATTLRLLASRRKELVGMRTQAVNRVHRELQPRPRPGLLPAQDRLGEAEGSAALPQAPGQRRDRSRMQYAEFLQGLPSAP